MTELLPFFIVLFAGLFFSEVFSRLHLPWVVALILAGVFIGPFGLDLFTPNATLEFLGEIGLVFLMFMAGLEIKLSIFKESRGGVFTLSFLNSVVPFLVGFGIGWFMGYGMATSLLLGIVFISSSIAVVIPSLEVNNVLRSKLGRSIVGATIIEDVLSLVLLSVLLQTVSPAARLPLPLFYSLLFLTVFILRWVIIKVRAHFAGHDHVDIFQQEFRSIFVILIGTVVSFQLLGLHPIVAGFFAGLVLSESITSVVLKEKLRAISYGIFIPIFFVIIGSKTNLGIFSQTSGVLLVTLMIVVGSMGAKFLSGFTAGKIGKLPNSQSALMGLATMPQLSTTLAVVFAGSALGIFDQTLITAMVILSIVTTFFSPLLIKVAVRYIRPETLYVTSK
ncbi:MAG: cation:proton antiporter [Candidatus Paceibacterota bacterium]